MFTDIQAAFDKLGHDIEAVFSVRFDTWLEGAPVINSPQYSTFPQVATCFIINTVALLDNALEMYISANYTAPWSQVNRLRRRIEFLKEQGELSDATRLIQIADKRNEYAHEAGKYGDFTELGLIRADVENELRHLHILK